jgi:hypothetical protein
MLSESVFDAWGNQNSIHILAEPQDDTNCLAAYRLHIGNRVFYGWAVSLNGQRLGMILQTSKNWVGKDWKISFATKYEKDLEPGFVQIMTAKNRSYLESMMKKLSHEIGRAMTARQADVVRLPIDPKML